MLGLYFVLWLWLGFGLQLGLGLVWCYGLGKFSVKVRIKVIPNDLRTPKKRRGSQLVRDNLGRFSIIYFMRLWLRIRVWVRVSVRIDIINK